MDHQGVDPGQTPRAAPMAVLASLFVVVAIWVYWPILGEMARRWSSDTRYSHGFLVPCFALFLLWYRRERLFPGPLEPRWWGLLLVALGVTLYLAGARYFLQWVEAVSLLPCLAGVCVLWGGRPALRWSWPAIAFLVFAIPLPYRVEYALGYPLQRIATAASTYILQTLGLPAVAEGYIIVLPDDIRVGVVEACNGLGMLMMFLAFATGTVLVSRRPLLDRVLILLSAVPIAVAANVVRITVTGLLHVVAGSELAEAVYHDLAGWLMMPLALAILWFEVWLLSHLLIEPPRPSPLPLGLTGGVEIGPRPHPAARANSGRD